MNLIISYRSRIYNVEVVPNGETIPTLEEVGKAIERVTGGSFETLKLLVAGRKAPIVPALQKSLSYEAAGLKNGDKVLLLASSRDDVQQIRQSKDLAGMRGFDDELRLAAARRGRNRAIVLRPPNVEYTFMQYEAWQLSGLYPAPSEALKILYRLANDVGILHVMAANQWRVGLLSEMPPEGKVGISPVCILGFNRSRGHEISLRLRTDDLKGFRKYEKIRETLVHELAHMVHDEHDMHFKQLNSELAKQVLQAHQRAGTALQLAASVFGPEDEEHTGSRPSELDELLDADDVMKATARLSGWTLRQLAAGDPAAGPQQAAAELQPCTAAAAAAALQRLQQASVMPPAGSAPAAAPADGAAGAAEVGQQGQQGEDVEMVDVGDAGFSNTPSEAASAAASVTSGTDAEPAAAGPAWHRYEHHDACTEAAEEALTRLGSLNPDPDVNNQKPDANMHDQSGADAQPPLHEHSMAGQPGLHSPTSNADNVGLGALISQPSALPHQHQLLSDQYLMPAAPGSPKTIQHSSTPSPLPQQQEQHQHQQQQQQAQQQQQQAQQQQEQHQQQHALQGLRIPLRPLPSAAEAGAASQDDVASKKFAQAWGALQRLADNHTAGEVSQALETLTTLLQNIMTHPQEAKYKQVRLSNATFWRRVGRLTGGMELLQVAGFETSEDVLRLRRNDPGLLWLVLSALDEAARHISAAVQQAQ